LYVLVSVLGGEHLRHERVLLLLLTRISHNKKIRVRWYINNVLFFFLSRSRVRKMLPSSLSFVVRSSFAREFFLRLNGANARGTF
jgi:hypothetical protein